jgi:hypothetical protein
LFRL